MNLKFENLVLDFSADNHILTITLNRPDLLNVINTKLAQELTKLFLELNEENFRVVVITGNGRAFSAGADLKERNQMIESDWHKQHKNVELLVTSIKNCQLPVIAAIEGYAVGGGCEIAMLCDFIVASESAVFALPEVTRGFMAGMGGTQLLPRMTGIPFAKEMLFTGRKFSAHEAKDAGLVNHLVPKGEALKKALELAQLIADNAPIAVCETKKTVNYGIHMDLNSALEFALLGHNFTINTEDRLEGVKAFNEKRKPNFKGK